MHYIEPGNRFQARMLSSLDEMIESDHIVRIIDLSIDKIVNSNQSLFVNKGQSGIGRKPYHPKTLLKLYVYGYLNRISSSRRLEKECHRNIELMWLLGELKPDHKTIADYRRYNGQQIEQLLGQLNHYLIDCGYIGGQTMSIDGSKIRANASQVIGVEEASQRITELKEQLSVYLTALDDTDYLEEQNEKLKHQYEQQEKQLLRRIKELEEKLKQLEQQKQEAERRNTDKFSLTDPDCRLMRGREGKHFSYNVQAVVDDKNKMLAAVKVIGDQNNDKGLLTPVIDHLVKTTGIIPTEIIADAGYYDSQEIKKLETERKTDCYIAINENQYKSEPIQFSYNHLKDEYTCSEGKRLPLYIQNKVDKKRNTITNVYRGIQCQDCSLKPQCTPSAKGRTIQRHLYQEWIDHYKQKMNSVTGKEKIKLRKQLAEHPFATLKRWMGKIPILLRGRSKVQSEINLYAFAYNLLRLTNIQNKKIIKQQFNKHHWAVGV